MFEFETRSREFLLLGMGGHMTHGRDTQSKTRGFMPGAPKPRIRMFLVIDPPQRSIIKDNTSKSDPSVYRLMNFWADADCKFWAMTADLAETGVLNRMLILDDLDRMRREGQIE